MAAGASSGFDLSDLTAYVINLHRFPGRRAHAVTQLRAAGLSHVVLDAVDGRALPHNDRGESVGTRYSVRMRRRFGASELACVLSHMQALLAFLASPAQLGLLLEDDFDVPPERWATLATVLGAGIEFDILKLCGDKRRPSGRPVWAGSRFEAIRTLKPTLQAHAYIVTKAGALKLIKGTGLATLPIYMYVSDTYRHGAIVVEFYPQLFNCRDDGRSAIAKDRDEAIAASLAFRLWLWLARRCWRLSHNVRRWLHAARVTLRQAS